jgi:hypothetical protein
MVTLATGRLMIFSPDAKKSNDFLKIFSVAFLDIFQQLF